MLRPSLLKCAALAPPAQPRCLTATAALPRPWPGLQAWRDGPLNQRRIWGPDGPSCPSSPPPSPLHPAPSSLAEWGALVLSTPDPLSKATLTHAAFSAWRGGGGGGGGNGNLPIGVSWPPDRPARSSKPTLVSTKEMPAPKNSGLPLNAYLLHNLAHVELNAIDLAWDTVVRFSPYQEELGEGLFSDFAHVADDESRHFGWCAQRLGELGFR